MFHTKGRAVSRIAAVMAASGLAIGGSIATAAADNGGSTGGVTATVQPTLLSGKIDIEGIGERDGGLFTMVTSDQATIRTYCIDFGHGVDIKSEAKYRESPWASSPLGAKGREGDAAKILWILENSYPKLTDLKALAAKAGIADAGKFTAEDAAAGTQAAIWNFSDHLKATPKDDEAAALRNYLVGPANVGIKNEPTASLSLTPDSLPGLSGTKVGPFTLNSSADKVNFALSDDTSGGKVKLVGKDGKAVGAALNGPIGKDTQLFFDVPAGTPAGSVSMTASVTTAVPTGRVFLSEGYTEKDHQQTMILAGSDRTTVPVKVKASWQPKGALPSATAEVSCVDNAVKVTVGNTGDQEGSIEIKPGKTVVVQPGKTETVLVPVGEDKAYDITVTGPNKFVKEFKGVLDCKVATPTPSVKPSPSPTGPQLATTGGGAGTGIMAGIAGALVIGGAAAVYALRRRGRHSRA
ncbi:Cys-Gln thioester bond-forming surface protein [Kitasatospora sp. NPDC048365]|uniref:Cys-Gln thioester bond-forming surface protein n=1 Tax=Kitasatospora sp. NPDC048365 TaxID=3364050 RepID=UPI0037183F7C